jgi:DNA-binding response OmpR family regulator
MYKLLIIEDNCDLAQTLADCFDKRLYHITISYEGVEGYKLARKGVFDLLIIDWLLPGKNGTDLVRQLRYDYIETPVLMMSSKNNVTDIVAGLKSGSDGYLCKPFNLLEFKTRVEAMLKRPAASRKRILSIGDIALDTNTMQTTVAGKPYKLRKKETLILKYLLQNIGCTLSREQIVNNIWDPTEEPYIGSIDVHISRLRKAIDKPFATNYIKTIHGIGYRLSE